MENSWKSLRECLSEIEDKIGYIFENKDLLAQAFVHRSFVNEHRHEGHPHNERLEFLGDSVLGLVISDFLYRRFPDSPEGVLSQLRSRLVDAAACAAYLQKLHLSPFILLGKGEKRDEGKSKISILSDAFEALIGALFLDGGWHTARGFLLSYFDEAIETTLSSPARNYKAELQDYSQKKFHKTPVYEVMQEMGPDHAKKFQVRVLIADQEMGRGVGPSKKEAEQKAAEEALMEIHRKGEGS